MLPFPQMPISRAPRRETRGRGTGSVRGKPPAALLAALDAPERVVFLDVETTGLSWFYDRITIVGWARGGEYGTYSAGDDLRPLRQALQTASALVTFNGTLFDLRFLREALPDLPIPSHHVDLRYLARRAGWAGTQKAIERLIGFNIRRGVEEVDGAEAVLLWHRHLRGDDNAFDRLIEYNRCDVAGMCCILDAILDRLDIHPDLWLRQPGFRDQATSILKQHRWPRAQQSRPVKRSSDFQELFANTLATDGVIIGIDLTGSEARPSGWCLLRGSVAETRRVSTDDEMFERVIAARPALVSIDSPLSIPAGRTRVDDDDPARAEFGIMRQCERELKRRGINVYPCLLPSMQKLTARGIRLAERFRAAGVAVIESYPGAAQDIMGIPRKGAGMEYLRQGLLDFGISGEFEREMPSHDELDAITAAVVGSFFLAGMYEALTAPTEGALIVPDLKRSGRSGLVVGISGRICAGKTTAARTLEARGFAYTRFSMVVDDEIAASGEPADRESRQRVGMELHDTRGQRWLCRKTLDRVSSHQFIVVDGLRFPEDHAFFVEQFGQRFLHLHLVASDDMRADRYERHERDAVPFAIADAQPVEARIDELASMATATVSNNASIVALRESVLKAVREHVPEGDERCLSQLS